MKPVTTFTPEPGGGPGGVLHLLGRPLPDTFGISVAPDLGWQGGSVTFIYGEIADGLADQVVADGEAFSRYPRVSRAGALRNRRL